MMPAKFVASVCCLCVAHASLAHAELQHPNIVLMMADDMGMGDTSAFQDITGNADESQLDTPQMERLASQGVRFTDAHTPSSRCSPTRYALLTGRYPWRNRLKHWVLYGSQGDPMIEADRPTIASMLRQAGYRTGLVGKWHVGLRYRRKDGGPAAGWDDADLTQPLHTTPLDHGFDFARFTSRSHGTSGPGPSKNPIKRNSPRQNVGPGHIHGRRAVAATGDGKALRAQGPDAYVLSRLGSRHSDHAMQFLNDHINSPEHGQKPFFLYYPSNANHGPYTPDSRIAGRPVAGAARTKSGSPMDARHDYIYENDAALGRLIDWLKTTDDPRDRSHKLIHNTLLIFTSDNGAEKNSDVATGPFRSNKGSVYEGGHRVPFMVAWPAGGVGDGVETTPGRTDPFPFGLQDLYATFAEITGQPLPDLTAGGKGAEDSFSVLGAFRGERPPARPPLFFNDHKEAKDAAVVALRMDAPSARGQVYPGQWKAFFDAGLLRKGIATPYELYDLGRDPTEAVNLIENVELAPLVEHLTAVALLHRTAGGHRLVPRASQARVLFDFRRGRHANPLAEKLHGTTAESVTLHAADSNLNATLSMLVDDQRLGSGRLTLNEIGLGIAGNGTDRVDAKEALLFQFSHDVIVESVAIVAGQGTCGGYYQVGEAAPLAIYCIDDDIDSKDQSGILSDIGVVRAGERLRLDSRRHFGVEAAGAWRLQSMTVRRIK